MSQFTGSRADLPGEQQSIRNTCRHPMGTFFEFQRAGLEQTVPERFEQQVARHANRLAVKTKTHTLTYRALRTAANRVARAIQAQGGGAEEPVAVLLEKDVPLLTAMLGVLKAGKIYVPLDPSYPYARTAQMVADSRASLLVTNNKNVSLARASTTGACTLLNLDLLDAHAASENPDLCISPESLACILYTSGSTGQPKGVLHSHRSLLHIIMRQTNNLQICPDDRVTFLGSCTSIGGIRDSLSALLNGAALLPFDFMEAGLERLASWLQQEEATIYNSAMPLFRQLAHTLHADNPFPKLRVLKWGGETLHQSDIDLYRRHFSPDCKVYIAMGCTEIGSAACYLMDKTTHLTGPRVPAGYANDDMEILLLDEAGRVIGSNDMGEIAVRSRYLSPGYWQRSDLTEEAFLPDPGGGDKRIYRTGDLGLVLPDGCLMHLGRKDWQVKVRGNRVEVAEIETALLALDGIREASVILREDQPDNPRLVAYLVSATTPALPVTTLQHMLARTLPAYMVPAVFMMLDALPLLPSGKVDRRALPVPGKARPELASPFVAPRTPVEEALAVIWAGALQLEQVGIHDNFLELGGDSLIAARIITKATRTLQVDLPLRALFESPTVADMAVVVTQNQSRQI